MEDDDQHDSRERRHWDVVEDAIGGRDGDEDAERRENGSDTAPVYVL